jgi:hypothetical protein
VSGIPEGSVRGAVLVALERLGLPLPAAPIARVVEPRPGRNEIHLSAREIQRKAMNRTQTP